MPLRGTVRKYEKAVYGQRPTLQNQITALKTQVSRNKPETQYFRSSSFYDHPSTGRNQLNILPTTTLINDTSFRDNVTGDKWRNLSIEFSALLKNTSSAYRIICYVPKKVGQRFSPVSQEFNRQMDPSAFWIIHDEVITHLNSNSNNATKDMAYKRRFNLRGLHTVYNSSSATLEKGEIIISVIAGGTAGSTMLEYGWDLKYQNI